MFGTGEPFSYSECGNCGALQLLDVPEDLSSFYPDGYYSPGGPPTGSENPLTALVRRARTEVALRLPLPIVEQLIRRGLVPFFFSWFSGLGLSTHSRILDVGCGDGGLLIGLRRQGFAELAGCDPHLNPDSVAGDSIRLHRGTITSMDGAWDLIMSHHSFEHIPNPRQTLEQLAERLIDRGAILIRTPVADSYAWRHYGTDWVALDPPRHLWVHTTKSIQILAEQCGLTVERTFRDGDSLQFWGSELYRRNMPLRVPGVEWRERAEGVFGSEVLEEFERRAEELNRSGEGDGAGFILRRRHWGGRYEVAS
jgi:SAM-dependent methyltransferase